MVLLTPGFFYTKKEHLSKIFYIELWDASLYTIFSFGQNVGQLDFTLQEGDWNILLRNLANPRK